MVVEEKTPEGGPKGGGKEELGEEEWVSLNTLTRLLNFTRTQERRREGVFVLEWMRGEVHIVVVEEIWMKDHLMRVDKELWNKHVFPIFDMDLGSKLVFMHEHVINNQEHVKNT